MASRSVGRWAQFGGPVREPDSCRLALGRGAREFSVAESFETVEGVSNVVLAPAAVELLGPANAFRPPESRRERPKIGEVSSLRSVQDRKDLAGGEVLDRQRWDAIDLLEWEQRR